LQFQFVQGQGDKTTMMKKHNTKQLTFAQLFTTNEQNLVQKYSIEHF